MVMMIFPMMIFTMMMNIYNELYDDDDNNNNGAGAEVDVFWILNALLI